MASKKQDDDDEEEEDSDLFAIRRKKFHKYTRAGEWERKWEREGENGPNDDKRKW